MNETLLSWAKELGFEDMGIEAADGGFNVLLFIPIRKQTDKNVDRQISPYYFTSNVGHAAGLALIEKIKENGYTAQIPRLAMKLLAAKLGLGSSGLSTLCVNPVYGARIFFFAIHTDMPLSELSFEKPKSPCASCGACVRLCPTKALDGKGGIDLNKCLRGFMLAAKPIPEELREPMGARILGCSICQDACPIHSEPGYDPCDIPEELDLEDILSPAEKLINQDLWEKRLGSNIIKKSRLRPQAVIAAANTGRKDLVPLIEKLAESGDETLAEHAKWALEKLLQQN